MIQSQPQPQAHWTPQKPLESCPPGLEYLSQLNMLIVDQQVTVLEMETKYEAENKYRVKNALGQQVFFAKETSSSTARNCCGHIRPFEMKILDNNAGEVMHLSRPLACSSCLCPCWLQSIEVTAPPGSVIGSVEQEWSPFSPRFRVLNANGKRNLRIKGPFCTLAHCGTVEFKVPDV